MSFDAQPGLLEPGMFSPGVLEQSQTSVSGSDTSSVTETNSLAVSLNDGDSSSATETHTLAVAVSVTETGSATDSESIVVQVSDSDTGSGSETESNSVPVSVTDTGSASETESIAVTLSDSDTSSSTEDFSLATTVSDEDTATDAETESLAVTLSDADTSTAVDSEEVNELNPEAPENSDNSAVDETFTVAAVTTTYDDTSSTSEDFSIVVSISGADTGSGAETTGDTATIVEASDTSAVSETFEILPGAEDSDGVSASESHSIAVTLSDSDGVSGAESQVSPGMVSATIGNYQATLVMGPASVYVADYGTAIPDSTAPLDASWIDLGGTLGSVVLTCVQEMEEKPVGQKVDNPASRLKTRDLKVETLLAEPTLANLLYALNQGSITTGSGYKSYEPPVIDRATPLTYRTIIIDGWAPGYDLDTRRHKRRRIVLRKALSTDGATLNYSKENQTGQEVSWSVHYVDSSTAPFKVIDEA